MEGAVVGPAEAELLKQAVGGAGEVAVGEEEQVLGLAHLFFAQEEVAGAGLAFGIERGHGEVVSRIEHGSHPRQIGQCF
ncbi:MAG: hypothetical protein NVSMB18_27800 [Acetobacteraceae bacterium]